MKTTEIPIITTFTFSGQNYSHSKLVTVHVSSISKSILGLYITQLLKTIIGIKAKKINPPFQFFLWFYRIFQPTLHIAYF